MAIQKVKFTSDSVKNTELKINNNFADVELSLSNKQDTIQFSTMPAASANYLGEIVQFIGTTDSTYTNGYFYKCVQDGSSYKWQAAPTQAASTVTLNGVATDSASFYAPTTAGTSGQVLKSSGSGEPIWGSLSASDVGALADSTKYGASLSVSGTSLQLKDQDGNNLGSAVTTQDTGATSVDDTGAGNAYTSASYDSATRKITFTKGETFQTATDSNLQTTAQTVVGAINEVNTVAKNANIAKGFTNYSVLITDLNAASATAYKVGQSLYVQTQEVPDLWIISVESSSSTYTYTTDAAFITATGASGGQQVGYYKLAQLETQKVDLSGYVQKTTTIAGVDLQDNITKTELLTALNVEDGAEVNDVTDVQINGTSILSSKVANFVTNTAYDASTNKLATMSDVPDELADLSADATHRLVTDTEKSTWNAKQDAKSTLTFTASDAGWSAIDSDGFYTLTITSTKTPLICFNSSGEQVLAELKSDGSNIYVITDTKFAGSVIAL